MEGTTAVYRLAPRSSRPASSRPCCWCRRPRAPDWGVGHDVLALAGLLALARFAVAAAAWDVANGFALMGASRDLMLSVFVEITLVLAIGGRGARRRQHGPDSDHRATAGTAVVDPGAGTRRGRLRARRGGRDGAPAGRQPRHPPGADHDPRGAAARVRRPRPGVPAVGGGGPPLGRAGARRPDLPAAPGSRGGSSALLPVVLVVALRRAGADRDAGGQDAVPARAAPARRPARSWHCSGIAARLAGLA